NKKQLSEDLARIREYGYSVSLGERESESGGVAVPIWGQEEEPTAVLGIYLPLTRMRQQKLVKLAMEYADQIATKFNTKKAGGSGSIVYIIRLQIGDFPTFLLSKRMNGILVGIIHFPPIQP